MEPRSSSKSKRRLESLRLESAHEGSRFLNVDKNRPKPHGYPPSGTSWVPLSDADFRHLLAALERGGHGAAVLAETFRSAGLAEVQLPKWKFPSYCLLVTAPQSREAWETVKAANLPNSVRDRLCKKLGIAHGRARSNLYVPFGRVDPSRRQRVNLTTGDHT
jgi:hypothetical protein